MADYDSGPETQAHIERVRELLYDVSADLNNRAWDHDRSKLGPDEKSYFDKYTPMLKGSAYNSLEYQQHLKGLGIGLLYHYRLNDHHPEYFSDVWEGPDEPALPIDCSKGEEIRSMSLIQLTEMLVDWKAASERHSTGDIYRSIEENQKRFGYGDELKAILVNTAKGMGW